MSLHRARIFHRAGRLGFCALVMGLAVATGPVRALPSDPGSSMNDKPDKAEKDDSGSTFDNVEIVDPVLNNKLTVKRVGSAFGENKLLSVFAGLANKTGRKLVIDVETIYKDKAGNELNTGSWIRLTLKPHEDSEYRSTAIAETAVDFLIRVRRPPAGSR